MEEINSPTVKVSYFLDKGFSNSFFINSSDKVSSAFHQVSPRNHQISIQHMKSLLKSLKERLMMPEVSTLNIIVSVVSVGAGILVSEMLKECGKDLWRAVSKLILPKNKQEPSEKKYSKDALRMELIIGDCPMSLTLEGLGQNSEAQVKEFVLNALPMMFENYLKSVNKL